MARRALLILGFAAVLFLATDQDAIGDDESVLKPARPLSGPATLADLGVRQLERLPWETYIVRFNLGNKRPVSISACYLMSNHLLVITAEGRVFCLDRRNLEPRWAATLNNNLVCPPAEGTDYYVFLTKDGRGQSWMEVFRKRNGAHAENFPRSLPFGTSATPAASGGVAYVPSLGRPDNVKTLETMNLLTGRSGWGYSGTGLIMGGAEADPDGTSVISASDDGVVTSLSTGTMAPSEENWIKRLSGAIDSAPAVTPDHVVVGTWDGLLYNLNVLSGEVNWMRTVDEPVRKVGPWVLGGTRKVKIPSEVEGAADVEVTRYEGAAFARTDSGLYAFDLVTGAPLFHDADGGRPILMNGNWLLVRHRGGRVTMRDASDGYAVKAELDLRMLTLVPTNRSTGAFFAVTHDGGVVAALPK